MENEKMMELDSDIKKDIKECKKGVELLEKILTMIVKGFAPEY
jgi:hypothetical protein